MKKSKRFLGLNRRMRKARKRGSMAVARHLYKSHAKRSKRTIGF